MPPISFAPAAPASIPTWIRSRTLAYAPLIAWALVTLAGLSLGPLPVLPAWFAIGAGLWLLASIVVQVAPRTTLSPAARVGTASLYLAGVAAYRHALGGSESGVSALVLIPILWLALFGTRRQLTAGFAVMIVLLVGPIVLIGGDDYPASEWRRVAILVGVAGFAGFAIQHLVANARSERERATAHRDELAEQVVLTEAVIETADDAVIAFDESGAMIGFNSAAAELLGWGDRSPAGLDLFDTLVIAFDRDRLRAGFRRLLDGLDAEEARSGQFARARQPRFETELIRADGTFVPVEATVGVVGPRGKRRVHAFARDITRRREAERAAKAHLDDLDRLLSVARDLGRPSSATDGRHSICDAARDLAGADLALFFEHRTEEGLLVATGASGSTDQPNRIALNARRSLTARVFATGEPTFVGDLFEDERVDRATAARMKVRAAFWQPVLREGEPIGILVIYWRTTRDSISDRVRSLLELFATQAAVVVERADLMGRLEALARTDPLTGLANRRALDEVLVRELAAAERSSRPLSIAMIDLDHFKLFNDANGHQAGDDLLRDAATAWAAELRTTDTMARFGGEEFLLVLPSCDTTAAVVIADRLRSVVPGDETASAGVATWDRSETMAELIARVDAALYEAKRLGRNRTVTAVAAPAREPVDAAAGYAGRRRSLRIAG